MDITETLALLLKFPGSLQALFTDRGPGEEAMAQAVEDIAEDIFTEKDGDLFCSDGQSYSLIWKADRNAWVNLDDL